MFEPDLISIKSFFKFNFCPFKKVTPVLYGILTVAVVFTGTTTFNWNSLSDFFHETDILSYGHLCVASTKFKSPAGF